MRSYLVLPVLLLAVTFAPAQAGSTARTPDGGMLVAQVKPIEPDTDASRTSADPKQGARSTRGMSRSGAKSRKVVKKSNMKKTRHH